jgi:hypothetical protein
VGTGPLTLGEARGERRRPGGAVCGPPPLGKLSGGGPRPRAPNDVVEVMASNDEAQAGTERPPARPGYLWRLYIHADHRHLDPPQVTLLLITGAALFGAALVGVGWAAGPPAVARALVHARWHWLILAPIGVVVSHLGYVLAYREATRAEGRPALLRRDAIAMVAAGFGAFNARGGFTLDAMGLVEFGLDEHEARRRVRVLGTIEYAVLALAAFVAAAVMAVKGEPAQTGLVPSWYIGVPAGTAVAVLLIAFRHRLAGRRVWRPPLSSGVDGVVLTASLCWSWPSGVLATAGMALYWAGDMTALGGCVAVFSHTGIRLAALIVGYATGYALTRRSLPLGGAGAVEALLPFALSWVSVPLASAVLAVAAYRAFNLWAMESSAIAGLIRLHRLRARAAAAAADHVPPLHPPRAAPHPGRNHDRRTDRVIRTIAAPTGPRPRPGRGNGGMV